MSRYFLFSSSLHFFLLLLLFIATRSGNAPAKAVYYIDFIGPSRVMDVSGISKGSRKKAAGNKKAETKKKPAKKKTAGKREKKEEIKIEENFILPEPSMLGETEDLFAESEKPAGNEAGEAGNDEKKGGRESLRGIKADFSNFPYPWYISQVRQNLAVEWNARMPASGDLEAVVRFEIKRDGGMRALKIEKSSGNPLFDNAALASARKAAPFARLPDDFPEEYLTVYVEFKTAN